jgi:hypothetical protein
VLQNQGIDIADGELLDYISESSTMSKSLEDYGERKSCATTTARRLADFLGDEMVKDKGLSCRYVVARDPQGAPVSERAIPVAIFETDPGTSVITTSQRQSHTAMGSSQLESGSYTLSSKGWNQYNMYKGTCKMHRTR